MIFIYGWLETCSSLINQRLIFLLQRRLTISTNSRIFHSKKGNITISARHRPSKNWEWSSIRKCQWRTMLTSLVKTVNFHWRNIYRIRRYITFESCHHLVRSLFLSRLDYANSLLFGISAKDRKKLETLQNKAARIIFRCNRLERVIYKVLFLTYKSVNKLAPAYLSELLKAYKPGVWELVFIKKTPSWCSRDPS